MQHLSCENLNLLWAELIIEELYRLGVQHVCIAPGSRSAPLTLAAAAHPNMHRHTHFDERGLGFLALGIAKSTRQPVAVICTSGTAVANLYPAFIEAAQSNYPLIALTADRPEELVDCGANQAIEQPGIFANYPSATLNLPAPTVDFPARALLGKLDDLLFKSLREQQPVQVNCRFREPFYPGQTHGDYHNYLTPIQAWQQSDQPLTIRHQGEAQPQTATPWPPQSSERVAIVLGVLKSESDAKAIVDWASKAGWPVFADIQSQAVGMPGVIHNADLLLQHPKIASTQLDRIIIFGGRLLGKRLQSWLDQQEAHRWQIEPDGKRLDPNWQLEQHWYSPIQRWLLAHPVEKADDHWRKTWLQWQKQLPQAQGENELSACQTLAGLIPSGSQLMLGNSLSIRHFQWVGGAALSPHIQIYSNRGCSGIDGLLATTCGLASNGVATTLVIGDTSLLHDLNSLALTRTLSGPLIIVVINNDGGAIFDLLPVPSTGDVGRNYYQLPHGFNFAAAAQQFQLNYARIESNQQLKQRYNDAQKQGGVHLLEVISQPQGAREAIHRLGEQVRELTSL